MVKQIPVYQSNQILTAAQLNQMWRSMVAIELLGFIEASGLPKLEFNIGNLTAIANGSLVGDILVREGNYLRVYNSVGALVDEILWEHLLQATETNKGIAEIATSVEALTGTDDTKFMTPLKSTELRGLEIVGTANISNDPFIEFTGLDDGFSHKFIFENVNPVTDDKIMRCLVSADGGSTYKNSYIFSNKLISSASTEVIEATNSATSINILGANNNYRLGSNTDEGVNMEVTLYNPYDTTALKRLTYFASYTEAGASLITLFGSAQDKTNTVIDAIKFFMDSGNLNTGKIIHYRYK